MDAELEFAAGLAREAGQFLLEKFRSGEWDARLKHDRSVVTSADLASDRMIRQAIQSRFPEDELLSEEQQAPQTVANQEITVQRHVWVIDPLDGTTNFSLGLPHWGVLIARLERGEPQIAAAYFPALDEMFTAWRSQGAWLNDRPLVAQPADPQHPLTCFACCSRTFRRYQVDLPYKYRILGSAAYTLCAVARGLAVIGFESVTKVWDLAAPWLVLKEAGGCAAVLQEPQPFPLLPSVDYSRQSFTVLAAIDPQHLDQGRRGITSKNTPAPLV